MAILDVIKVLAIGITIVYILRNNERASNILGWSLIVAFSLSIGGIGMLSTLGLVIYLLTLATAVILTISKNISTPNRTLLILLLIGVFINGVSRLLNMPNFAIFVYLAIAATLIYIYFQFRHQRVNVLVLTSIPVVDCIFIITDLIN